MFTDLPEKEINGKKYAYLTVGAEPNVREFALGKFLGKGGEGVVYKGYEIKNGHVDTEKPLAIKKHDMNTGETLEVMLQWLDDEAKIQSNLYKTEILFSEKYGVVSIRPKLPGKAADEIPAAEFAKLSLSQSLELAVSAAQTIAELHRERGRVYQHRQGLYQRDLKPANFLIHIASRQCHVIDFAAIDARTPTTTAPEFARGAGIGQPVDHVLEMETYSMVSILALILGETELYEYKANTWNEGSKFTLQGMKTSLRAKGRALKLEAEMEEVIELIQSMCDANPAIRPSDLAVVKVLTKVRIACLRKELGFSDDVDEDIQEVDKFFAAIKKGQFNRVKRAYNLRQFIGTIFKRKDNLNLLSAVNLEGLTALGLAVKYGRYNIAKYLLQKYTSTTEKEIAVKQTDHNGRTLLHLAVLAKRTDLVKLLLKNGANANQLDADDRSPLHCALAMRCDAELVQLLLESGADVSKKNSYGKIPLQVAITNACSLKVVEAILEKNNTRSSAHGSQVLAKKNDFSAFIKPIKMIVSNSKEEKVLLKKKGTPSFIKSIMMAIMTAFSPKKEKVLLKENDKPSPTAPKTDGLPSPLSSKMDLLYLAVVSGSDELVQRFWVNDGLTWCNDNGESLFHFAVRLGHAKVAQLLIKKGIDINTADNNQRTPLHVAILAGEVNLAKWLIRNGANIQAKDKEGCTPLHLEIIKGNLKLMDALLKEGADINAVDNSQKTPLHVAILTGQGDFAISLVLAGADASAKDSEGRTPLHLATLMGSAELVRFFCRRYGKAGIDVIDNEGRTPLHYAVKHGHVNLEKILIQRGPKINAPAPHSPVKQESLLSLSPAAKNDVPPVQPEATTPVNSKNNRDKTLPLEKVLSCRYALFDCRDTQEESAPGHFFSAPIMGY